MEEKKIHSVSDNYDKYETYTYLCGRYKKAMKYDFCFEAMNIVYAMLEDRMRSFLFYIGAFRKKEDKNLNVKKTKKILRRLYFGSDEQAENKKIEINKIATKIKLIKSTLQYAEKNDEQYLNLLTCEYARLFYIQEFIAVLDKISDWCLYRNEVIHGLMNKNIDDLYKDLRLQVEAGKRYVLYVDANVKKLRRKNAIRKVIRIKT